MRLEEAAKEGRHESWESAVEALAPHFKDGPSLVPVPVLWPELRAIDRAHGRLPKDQDGRTSHAEVRSWMEEEGVTDRGLRELCFDLFATLDLVMGELRSERWERERKKAEAERGRR